MTNTIKTFLATWRPAGGVIRVVVVQEEDGWVAFFSADPQARPEEILEAMADRSALEVAHAQYPSSNILPDRRRAG